ncbi:SEC-C domain-containing protein [Asanoa sp. WMMD1127]|uniref:SEC-C domain-containing protein n=1 Tax=Asanoa sp. WMMD1127 TaxID=3016107 RepID=UPI0024161843|nr:SEC-C domain-containing protein [Asanoa sp. WMMD1127]MDG4822319.1 SEC-C domain-containing protein [Asanoa sp. WMMD1127]
MTTSASLTLEELADIAEEASAHGDLKAAAAELVAAVDDARLADSRDVPAALGIAAELLDNADDQAGSLVLTERAIEVHRAMGSAAELPRIFRARLLFGLGRSEEAMAELTALRPRLLHDAEVPAEMTESLLAGGHGKTALDWLTEAAREARDAFMRTTSFDDDGEQATAVLFALLTERHHLRHDLDLPHDSLDEMAEELEEEAERVERARLAEALATPVLFFPREEFVGLGESVPGMAASWDAHRGDVERLLVARSDAGLGIGCEVVPGSATELTSRVDRADGGDLDDTLADYARDLDERGLARSWPPARNDACWCGSGAKYKKCCLPRSRA